MTYENCNVTELLARRLDNGNEIVLTLIGAKGSEQAITAAEYRDRVMSFASHFGPVTGSPRLIGICLDLSLDLHAAYIGAIWAGHIPTMLAPPSPRMDPEKYARSLAAQLAQIRPELLPI